MTEIIPINAIIKVAILPTLSARAGLWKKTARLIIPKSTRGIKIVHNDTHGNLYRGIWKCAYWKFFIFSDFFSSYFLSFPFSVTFFLLNLNIFPIVKYFPRSPSVFSYAFFVYYTHNFA